MSLSCVARPPQSMKFGIFTSYSGNDGKEMYEKACYTCEVQCGFAYLNLLLISPPRQLLPFFKL